MVSSSIILDTTTIQTPTQQLLWLTMVHQPVGCRRQLACMALRQQARGLMVLDAAEKTMSVREDGTTKEIRGILQVEGRREARGAKDRGQGQGRDHGLGLHHYRAQRLAPQAIEDSMVMILIVMIVTDAVEEPEQVSTTETKGRACFVWATAGVVKG